MPAFWIICISHLPREYLQRFETATDENRRQPARRFLSPVLYICIYVPFSPLCVYTPSPPFKSSLPAPCPRYSKLAISLCITSPRASSREILISTTVCFFFFISYYISLLFRESESDSFFRNKNRKKKCHVNALHYISY